MRPTKTQRLVAATKWALKELGKSIVKAVGKWAFMVFVLPFIYPLWVYLSGSEQGANSVTDNSNKTLGDFNVTFDGMFNNTTVDFNSGAV